MKLLRRKLLVVALALPPAALAEPPTVLRLPPSTDNAQAQPRLPTQPRWADTPPADSLPSEHADQWIAVTSVRLQALDKVNAQAQSLTVKVGQPVSFGSLTITVRACMIRPVDQPPDAAAYLAVTDSHPDSPGFDGWMLSNEPSVSMMQHPIYDLRVSGCG